MVLSPRYVMSFGTTLSATVVSPHVVRHHVASLCWRVSFTRTCVCQVRHPHAGQPSNSAGTLTNTQSISHAEQQPRRATANQHRTTPTHNLQHVGRVAAERGALRPVHLFLGFSRWSVPLGRVSTHLQRLRARACSCVFGSCYVLRWRWVGRCKRLCTCVWKCARKRTRSSL